VAAERPEPADAAAFRGGRGNLPRFGPSVAGAVAQRSPQHGPAARRGAPESSLGHARDGGAPHRPDPPFTAGRDADRGRGVGWLAAPLTVVAPWNARLRRADLEVRAPSA